MIKLSTQKKIYFIYRRAKNNFYRCFNVNYQGTNQNRDKYSY